MIAFQGGLHEAVARVESRELMWNLGIASHVLMYALLAVSFAFFGLGLRRRIREWRAGRPEGASLKRAWGARAAILLREALAQRQTRRRFLPGLFHSFVFYGFAILFAATLIVMVDMDFRLHIFHGPLKY